MKSPATKKISLASTPRQAVAVPQPVHHLDVPGEEYEVGNTFFAHQMKAGGITQKEVLHHFRVNKTTAHGWYMGLKRDPFIASKLGCDLLRKFKRTDLIAPTLAYIAGMDFDEAVLQRMAEVLRTGK